MRIIRFTVFFSVLFINPNVFDFFFLVENEVKTVAYDGFKHFFWLQTNLFLIYMLLCR